MIAAELEEAIERRLHAPVRVAIAATGREALAEALRAAGRPDAPITRWPCPFASLTHSGDVAIAVAVPPDVPAIGIGVDLEHDRPIKAGMARLICDTHERAWLATVPAELQPFEVLRLWTAKEALYKADPEQGDAIVADYALESPSAAVTTGGRVGSSHHATLVSLRRPGAVISIALCLTGEST